MKSLTAEFTENYGIIHGELRRNSRPRSQAFRLMHQVGDIYLPRLLGGRCPLLQQRTDVQRLSEQPLGAPGHGVPQAVGLAVGTLSVLRIIR